MANSYLFTRDGIAIVVDNSPYNVHTDHPSYDAIVEELKALNYAAIPDLYNAAKAIERYVATAESKFGAITVNGEASLIYFNGEVLKNSLVDHIMQMLREGFKIDPFALFLDRLMKNPSKKAIDAAFRWIEKNGMTISEDGFLLAYKRVRDDFTSFHDQVTKNDVGTYVELERWKCDDRSEVTCSTGLHFCSQSYLPNYCSGQGRVLLLKIDPADIVSIPNDYNESKGRACRYLVLQELKNDTRADVEVKDVMPQPVLAEEADVNQSRDFKEGYVAGYKDGRGKQKRKYVANDCTDSLQLVDREHARGYCAGYADGRAKKAKLY